MTLSNIFIGKKVVKQAYLNNALIYQSNGWQTLPSTCSEVWTKSYDSVSAINAITKDNNNNVYIGAGNTIYQFDTEGNLKWKYSVGANIAYNRIITAIVAYPTFVYCAYYGASNSMNGYISKIDVNGNLLSDIRVNNIISVPQGTYFVDMQRDDNNIYAITTSNIIKLSSDLDVIDNAGVLSPICIATNNGPYVFVGTNNCGVRFDKTNFKNSTQFVGSFSDFITNSIALDNIGNLYLGSRGFTVVQKIDIESGKLIMNLSNIQSCSICTDFQENVYCAYSSGVPSLCKYTSDGTLVWNITQISARDANIKVITDSNGNIYVAYVDSNSMLTIKKLINLIKEN